MEEHASLRAKPQLVGALSPALLMEGFLSCLARLSQPKHISPMQGRDSIPTTLLSAFRHWAQMAPMPVILKRVCSTIPGMERAPSNHARTFPWGSPASVSCYESNQGYELVCSTSTVIRRISETNVQTMLPLLVQTCSFQIKQTHSLDPFFIRLQFSICAM